MAVLEVDQLRAYLRIDSHVEDELLADIIAEAVGDVEAYIRIPIEARAVTLPITPTWAGGNTYSRRLTFPHSPIEGPITITHDDGTTLVESTDYTAQLTAGRFVSLAGGVGFDATPYTVTAVAGLSLKPEYDAQIKHVMRGAVRDWAADLYQRRNPAASYESGGGGVAVNYNETASKTMPSRIRVTLDPWRRMLV